MGLISGLEAVLDSSGNYLSDELLKPSIQNRDEKQS